MSLYLDIHALHTLPPSNINRDDTGAPKTASFGGVPRQRVSSQAWKSAIRRDFAQTQELEKLGIRTRRVAQKVLEKILELEPGYDQLQAEQEIIAAFKTLKIKLEPVKSTQEEGGSGQRKAESSYLLLLSVQQITRLAQAIVQVRGEKISKADLSKILDQQHSLDIALFGRMLADAPDFNVDASCQVAHAIGVHESEPEFDYFTAVDDVVQASEESGAGMIGTIEMMSSTLYRYATVNLKALQANLDSAEAALAGATAFLKSFISAMPTGKQNTFANHTLPEAVLVTLRDDRPVSYVNAFETPVTADTQRGRRYRAAQALAQEAQQLSQTYGLKPRASYVLAVGELQEALAELGQSVSLASLETRIAEDISEALVD
ncbi:MAG: type I-E CRISPR-associated protein Cas7/Cse4/CasC [Rothia sp. (in: high G+C Gram-positive bacteria)]|nr:type I-E CRISPR-associated protein Cas7/Cse4/CasC [Rothia sp. (in: high G+C Gram-positive bacteria)]